MKIIAQFAKSVGVAAVMMLAIGANAAAQGLVDSASFELGSGSKVRMARVAVQSDWDKRWFAWDGHHLSGYWEANLAYWRGNAYRGIDGQRQNLAVIGLTPVFRFQRDDKLGWYAEGGIGANLTSQLYYNNGDRLSTAFQFGDHLGVGYVTRGKWDLGLKYQHYSNGSIKKPNSGVNFLVAKATYRF